MKKALLVLGLIFSSSIIYSQNSCFADAGEDRVFCLPAFGDTASADTSQLTLGGFPAASGGVGPYTYTWTMTPFVLEKGQIVSAADILNDTTIANPLVTFFQRDEQTFFLTVRDSAGAICRDTVTIVQNIWNVSLVEYDFFIEEGETITLNEPNFNPKEGEIDSILWRPNRGMIDSTSLQPVVSPSQNTSYYVTVWDEAGCRASGRPFQHVTVYPLGVEEATTHDVLKIHPNPATDFIEVVYDLGQNPTELLQITSAAGTVLKEERLNNKNTRIDISGLSAGWYVITLKTTAGEMLRTKLVVR